MSHAWDESTDQVQYTLVASTPQLIELNGASRIIVSVVTVDVLVHIAPSDDTLTGGVMIRHANTVTPRNLPAEREIPIVGRPAIWLISTGTPAVNVLRLYEE